MVDLATVRYRVLAYDEKKKKYNITDYVQELGFEERDGEISMRTSFTIRNDKVSGEYISKWLRPGCMVRVLAKHDGGKFTEVARGNVVTWSVSIKNSANDLECVCYDDLYALQKSQDNFYFRSGTSAKTRVRQVLKKWKVPSGAYQGPEKKLGKKKFQNQCLSDIILGILKDAEKTGWKKYVLRMEKGKACIRKRGGNDPVYVFRPNVSKAVDRRRSTEDLVTRVKVIGKSDKEGPDSVSATLNGLTKYGIRQKIYTMGTDETLKQAKKEAKEILDENGDILEEMSLQSPDVPFIRKGDLVYVKAGRVDRYYFVESVRHEAFSGMTMELVPAGKTSVSNNKKMKTGSFHVGDTVTFQGGKYYASADGKKSFSAGKGKAKVTKKKESAKHPYYLVHSDKKSSVHGWVDAGMFQ